MGIAYKLCDCRHSTTQNEENDLSYNNKINQKIFSINNNNNDSIINLNNDDSKNTNNKNNSKNFNTNYKDVNLNKENNNPPLSKDTIDFNKQVNILAKSYKKDIPKKALNEKLKYNFNLRKNKTPKLKNIFPVSDDESNHLNNYNSYYTFGDELKNRRTLLSNKEFKYIGEKSKNNLKEGFGISIWNNKTKYIGTYKNNKADGYGKFIDENLKYKGEFKNDVACGFGIYTKGKELLYAGYWLDDLQEQYGCETWFNNSEYYGEYKLGKKNGIGVYNWFDGSRYEGNWNMNKREGYGIMYYTKEKIYVGEWKNNARDGFGELLSKDKKYIGFFVKDKKHGFGIIYFNKTNKAYMGFWKQGKKFGFGKIMTRNKRKYGIWIDENSANWFKSEEEAFDYLDSKGLKNYKSFFVFTLDDIRNYCINNDEFNSLLE